MNSRLRFLLILVLTGVATVGIYVATSANATECGQSGVVVDSAGIAIKKLA